MAVAIKSCQVQSGTPNSYFAIGTQDSAKFVADDTGGLTLQYTSTTDTTRTTYLTLVCDASQDPGTFTAAGEDPSVQATYDMTYTGKYACPNSGPGPGPDVGDSGGISVGSILCIVFFALLIVYFAAGIAFQVFIRKASGKEIIPQSGLWLGLPGLVKVCQKQPGSPPNFFNIGLQVTADFITDQQDLITLEYNDQTSTKRTSHIALVCDQTQDPGTVSALGEVGTANYHLTYTGKYACPTSSPPITTPNPGGEPSGLSVGSILCIIVFSVLIVYFVAGVLIQKFVRKATGKEIIPQYTIWSAGPALIKDGVLFVVKRGKVGKGYENI